MAFCSRPGVAFERRRAATSATTSKYSQKSAAETTTPEHRADHDARVDVLAAAGADRDDRLAERDQHDQPEALGEVARHEPPAVEAEELRAAHVEHQREQPDPRPATSPRTSRRSGGRSRCAVLIARPITDERRPGSSRLPRMKSAMCATRTTVIAAGEEQRVVAEHVRHAQRDDQQRRPSPR